MFISVSDGRGGGEATRRLRQRETGGDPRYGGGGGSGTLTVVIWHYIRGSNGVFHHFIMSGAPHFGTPARPENEGTAALCTLLGFPSRELQAHLLDSGYAAVPCTAWRGAIVHGKT